MKIRLYVDKSSEKACDKGAIKAMRDETQGRGCNFAYFDGICFNFDERGLSTEIDTFVGGMPRNLQCFTFSFVTIYEQDQADMYNAPLSGFNDNGGVESIVDTFYNSGLPSKRQSEFWRIRISGPDFETVVNRYKEIRSGEAIKDAWTGPFVENVTSLARILPALLISLDSLNSTKTLIFELLAELRKKGWFKKFMQMISRS